MMDTGDLFRDLVIISPPDFLEGQITWFGLLDGMEL
jgi:hypothetical protein